MLSNICLPLSLPSIDGFKYADPLPSSPLPSSSHSLSLLPSSFRAGREREGGKGKEYLISPPEHIYFSGDTAAALPGFNGIVGVPFYYFLQQFRPDIKAGKSYSSLEPRRKRICRSRASRESRVIASR